MNILVFVLSLLITIVAYMSLWYGLARLTDRYDVVDSAWGLGFVLVAWTSLTLRSNFSKVGVISAIFVTIWGLRLFGHIANRNWRKHEDDHRYQAMRSKWGSSERRKFFTNVFLLQGLLVCLVSLPMIAVAFQADSNLNLGVYGGLAIWLFGIIFEAIGDYQLSHFIKNRPDTNAIMNKGLWRYTRHPNYFGEVASWWGAGIVAVSVGGWWGFVGTLVITFLITKVSGIPPLEKHYAENAKYNTYRKATSVFIPLPPKKPTVR